MIETALFPFSHRVEKTFLNICLLLLLFLILAACGRKAPPIFPETAPPPKVTDLSAQIQEKNVALKWSLADEDIADDPEIEGFYVYQAVISKEDQDCKQCPIKFERIAEVLLVPYSDLPDGRQQWQYKIPVDSGYRYAFKVNILFSQSLGPDSNIVEIEP